MNEISPSATPGSDFDWRVKLAAHQYGEAARLHRLAVDTGLETRDETVEVYLGWLGRLEQSLHDKAWDNAETAAASGDLTQPTNQDAHFPEVTEVEREATQLAESGRALDQRSPEKARPLLEDTSGSSPAFLGEVYAQLGTLALMEGDDATAEARLVEAVEAHPKHLRARVNLGNLKLEAGDVEGAIALYEAVLAIDDQYPSALHNLGVAYRRSGNIAKSVRTLRRAAGAQRRSDTRTLRQNTKTGSPVRRAQWGWMIAITAVLVAWLLVR